MKKLFFFGLLISLVLFTTNCTENLTDSDSPQNISSNHFNKTSSLFRSTENTGCREYDFYSSERIDYPDYPSFFYFEDLLIEHGKSHKYFRDEHGLNITEGEEETAETPIILPNAATSVIATVCSYFEAEGSLNNIGSKVKAFDENGNFITEVISEDNTSNRYQPVQVVIQALPGTTIKKLHFDVKYPAGGGNFPQIIFKLEACYLSECTAPTVTANSSMPEIWPPNNKTVKVNFFGNITNSCGGGSYTLTDEYGEVSYSGDLESGDYSVLLNLISSRKGNDKDGRKYTFTVTSSNSAGTATAKAYSVVLHDKRK